MSASRRGEFVGLSRPPTREAVGEGSRRRLRAPGLRRVMLTGDAEATARATAAAARARRGPRRGPARGRGARDRAGWRVKVEASRWRGTASTTRPALAGADVGIAMGTGSDVAIESAAMTLAGGDIAALPRAVRLSRATLAQHPAEPLLRVRLQRRRRARRRGCAVSGVRPSPLARPRERRDDVQLAVRRRQCPAPEEDSHLRA